MKNRVAFALALGVAFLLSFQAAPPPPPPSYEDMVESFEQHPPVPIHYWVQKLSSTLPGGLNMAMTIEYRDDGLTLPDTLRVYSDSSYIAFRDDGHAPDVTAHDRIYSAFIKENISNFTSQVLAVQSSLRTQRQFLHFTGHLGEVMDADNLIEFDEDGFNHRHAVEIDALIVEGINCGTSLLKQNSLFITDLSVVEDPARTYNYDPVSQTWVGNPTGVWTFGNLIYNMANQAGGGVSAKSLLKNWLSGWTDGRSINGQTVAARTDALKMMILPWLIRANGWLLTHYSNITLSTLLTQWKTDWDATSETNLLQKAPFKLMAIVNRLDLHGNHAYSTNGTNFGETRFIYTLEAPYGFSDGAGTTIGCPPRGADGMGSGGSCASPIDWEGMNVIIEYGNPSGSFCSMKSYAQQWLDLSGLTLGSSDFNDALEDITHVVIDANADLGKPNKSALDQLRTNERIFFPSACNISAATAWVNSDWQLSQFQLNSGTHLLTPVPVTNTPMNESNLPFLLSIQSGAGTDPTTPGTGSTALLDWVFLQQVDVSNGNHSIPTTYSYGGDMVKLAATADIDAEQVHYWDLNWDHASTTHYTNVPFAHNTNYPVQKLLRRNLSLNTCQGCHSGETKTVFTQVRPLPYGQSANYWGATPNGVDGNFPVDSRSLDTRFASTAAQSNINGTAESAHALTNSTQYFPRVSAFLTGRNYSGTSGTYQDDVHSISEDAKDNVFDDPASLFYVYDPSDNNDGFNDDTYPGPDQVHGYNDLQMRKQRLCQLVNQLCPFDDVVGGSGSVIVDAIMKTSFLPLARRSH